MNYQPISPFEHDQSTGVLPYSSLYGRIAALGRRARSYVSSAALYGVGSGAVSTAIMGFIGLAIWEGTHNPVVIPGTHPPYNRFYQTEELLTSLLIIAIPTLCGVTGFFIYKALLQKRFRRSYDRLAALLVSSALPILIADESFCLCLLAGLRERGAFLINPPPAAALRLEDQLLLAASYERTLARGSFATGNDRSGELRHGTRGYDSSLAATHAVNLLASLGCILIPTQLRNLLREAEQQGALAAICDYFADAPGRSPK